MDRIAILKKAFPGLSDDLAQHLIQQVREVTYPRGTLLCKEGEVENTFYLILEGQVEITKWLEYAREERFLRHSNPGDFFGEVALIHESTRGASVRTTMQTTVMEMNRDEFIQMLSDTPTMALAMVRTTIERLRSNDQMQFDELRKTYESLQRLDQAKLDFIEVAAHELRTPLTVIQGYSKVLSLAVQNPDTTTAEIMKGLQEGINRMLNVVNAMLDVTRIDSNMLTVAAVPVLPRLVAGEATSLFISDIEKRHIAIVQNHQPMPGLPFIYADPTLMNKLFFQLVSNAIKYTPDGGTIEISTLETHDSRVGHGVEIMVKDNGVGIADKHLPHIFEKFYQGGDVMLHSSSKTSYMGGGPGLGLAIAHGIVAAHKGFIWAESPGYDPEKRPGATFHVLLPEGKPV